MPEDKRNNRTMKSWPIALSLVLALCLHGRAAAQAAPAMPLHKARRQSQQTAPCNCK
jgi:hypothetical protein